MPANTASPLAHRTGSGALDWAAATEADPTCNPPTGTQQLAGDGASANVAQILEQLKEISTKVVALTDTLNVQKSCHDELAKVLNETEQRLDAAFVSNQEFQVGLLGVVTDLVRQQAPRASASELPAPPPRIPDAQRPPTPRTDTQRTPFEISQPASPLASTPSHGSLSTKEVLSSLDSYSGNKDKTAQVIDPDDFMHFCQWFETAKWKMFLAGVPASRHALLCQKLAGPVLKTFIRCCEVEGWNMQSADCTMDMLKQRLSSLFQDAVVLYTDKVITMSFKAASLAQDLQNFRLYVQYSSFASSADKNAYVYNLVREKMHSAVPNCLVTAQTKYQLSLDDTLPFEAFLDAAIKFAHRLQTDKVAVGSKRSADTANAGAGGGGGGNSNNVKRRADGPSTSFKSLLSKQPSELLKGLNRCGDCGFFLQNMTFSEHKKVPADQSSACKPAALSSCLDAVRASCAKNQDPNAAFTSRGTSPAPASNN